jgi:hypothetical protein
VNKDILESIKGRLCTNGIWDFSLDMKEFYEKVTATEVDKNLKELFPAHFLKIQHTLYDLASWDTQIFHENPVTLFDVECGMGTASLAVFDFFVQVLLAYDEKDIPNHYGEILKFNFILNDESSSCLEKAQHLIKEYISFIAEKHSFLKNYLQTEPTVYAFPYSYPEVIPYIQPIITESGPIYLTCFNNTLVQLVDKFKCDHGITGYCKYCDDRDTRNCIANRNIIESHTDLLELQGDGRSYSMVMIMQEQDQSNLILPVLPSNNLTIRTVKIPQRNYNSSINNYSYESAYKRALYHYWGV